MTFSVWDLTRLHRFASSGTGREDVLIDLEADFGGPLPALPAHLTEADYEAYLVVVPGAQLAAIYDRWGARLLEQNVRVFLQARGNVNKGIRNTLEYNSEMFFAYNNGITATAEAVEIGREGGGIVLTGLRTFRSSTAARPPHPFMRRAERRTSSSNVFVQMKLSIVDPERAMEIVPKISEYANTQNRVSAADFFANHPFHIRLEEFSRRIFAPSPDGTSASPSGSTSGRGDSIRMLAEASRRRSERGSTSNIRSRRLFPRLILRSSSTHGVVIQRSSAEAPRRTSRRLRRTSARSGLGTPTRSMRRFTARALPRRLPSVRQRAWCRTSRGTKVAASDLGSSRTRSQSSPMTPNSSVSSLTSSAFGGARAWALS